MIVGIKLAFRESPDMKAPTKRPIIATFPNSKVATSLRPAGRNNQEIK